MLEVGCGVGNFIWPLLHEDDSVFFYACDFSPRAVQFVKVSLMEELNWKYKYSYVSTLLI